MYDLLFGKGLQCGGHWKATILAHRARLQAELAKLKVKKKVSSNRDLLTSLGGVADGMLESVILPFIYFLKGS